MLGAWTERQEPQDSAAVTEPSAAWGPPGRGCFTYTPRRAQEKAHHQHISFSCILMVRIGPLPWQAACPWMETLNLSEKWAEAGGAVSDSMDLPSLPAHCWEGSAPQRGFYRKGLNRRLPRQTKPASGLALEMEAKAGRGEE